MNKKQKKRFWKITFKVFRIIFILELMILTFFIGLWYENIKMLWSPTSSINYNKDCSNLSLFDTSNCLRKELSTFFNYNLSNKYLKLSDEELKEKGGVCWQYSEWYEKRIKEIGGFDTKNIIIKQGNLTHEFNIISDEGGYCILDQTNIRC